MAPREAPLVNPTPMRRTIMLCGVMTLMFVNFLLDSEPRHVAYRAAQLAQAEQPQGFVEELDEDDPLAQSDCESPAPRHHHFPTPQDSKTKWPYPRHRDRYYDVEAQALQSEYERIERMVRQRNPVSKGEASDAWVRMKSARRVPSERAMRGEDGKKKRVRWGYVEVFTYYET
ncbi:hypothetical protein P280DRAFT_474477 [Massarina eburnea CBS 473.64]|uniref:Uncharacterized protein n=1 Tax=Massarina eburnea CBS 473.64 TaxID=1395130 RepID=A0A6A6RHX9_9PLEO|nr:hypothetical protein P280DRAFT_474477 [Massarina eburnea CBS 473.64]